MTAARTKRKISARYPVLFAASLGVAIASCGPGPDPTVPAGNTQALSQGQPDAGPQPPDFIGGDVAFETYPPEPRIR